MGGRPPKEDKQVDKMTGTMGAQKKAMFLVGAREKRGLNVEEPEGGPPTSHPREESDILVEYLLRQKTVRGNQEKEKDKKHHTAARGLSRDLAENPRINARMDHLLRLVKRAGEPRKQRNIQKRARLPED